MLAGRRYRLERPTLALGVEDGKRRAVTLPAGAVIKVVAVPTGEGDRMVDVHWNSQTVTMFAIDVDVRGTEIREKHAGV